MTSPSRPRPTAALLPLARGALRALAPWTALAALALPAALGAGACDGCAPPGAFDVDGGALDDGTGGFDGARDDAGAAGLEDGGDANGARDDAGVAGLDDGGAGGGGNGDDAGSGGSGGQGGDDAGAGGTGGQGGDDAGTGDTGGTGGDDAGTGGTPGGGDDAGVAAGDGAWVQIDYSNAFSSQSPAFSFSPGSGDAFWAFDGASAPQAWDRFNDMQVSEDPIGRSLELSDQLQLMIGLRSLSSYDHAVVRIEGRAAEVSSDVLFDVYNPLNGCGVSGVSISNDWVVHVIDVDLGDCLLPGEGVQAVRVVPENGTIALVRMRVTLVGANE